MRITDRIHFRQPKYMLPAIVYIPLLATGYFVFDMFNTEVAETQDKSLQTTEFLNPTLPGAQIKNGDGIGGKYENMAKSYGRIADYSAVDNIERDNEEEREAYESSTQKKTLRNSSVRRKKRTMPPKLPMPRRERRKHSTHSTRRLQRQG